MIEVVFLGVGEAFDETLPNTSILIRYGEGPLPVTVLLDCGFTAPPQFWREEPNKDSLDAIWISHFHGDHTLGIPALLVRFWEEGRHNPLIFLGQKGLESFTRRCVELAYPGFQDKLEFPLKFLEVEPRKEVEAMGLTFRTAQNAHSQRDLALRIDAGNESVYYSGDGRPTSESMVLAKGSTLIIHEAFHMDTEVPGHGTVTGSIDMAKRCEASILALVHLQREVRKQVTARIEYFRDMASPLELMVPEPGEKITLRGHKREGSSVMEE
ncbi:MAG: ribonuclease Z [Pseudomonadota bacterium]